MVNYYDKVRLLDAFINGLGTQIAGVPYILDNSKVPKDKSNESLYRVIEEEAQRLGLVHVVVRPHTNETPSGWGTFRLNNRGQLLVSSNKSVSEMYPEESRLNMLHKLLIKIQESGIQGISPERLGQEFDLELYPTQKLVDILESAELVKVRHTATKSNPEGKMLSTNQKGEYACQEVTRLDEILKEDLDPVSPVVQIESIRNSIVNKGQQVTIQDSNIDMSKAKASGGLSVEADKTKLSEDPATGKNQRLNIIVSIVAIVVIIVIAMVTSC